MGIWDEEDDIGSSPGERPDWFTEGSADMWGATGSRLRASSRVGKGTVSGTKEGVTMSSETGGQF